MMTRRPLVYMKQLNMLLFKAKEMMGDKNSSIVKIVILTYSIMLFSVAFCTFIVTGVMAMTTTTNSNAIAKSSMNTTVTTQPSKGLGPKPDFLTPYNKGVALLNLGKYNESIAYFDKALAINPKNVVSLYNKGAVLNKLGKYNESIAYFDKVLAEKPTNKHALVGKELDLAALSKINTGTTTTPQNLSAFGFYFGSRPTNATGTPPTNAHKLH